ncbi:tryptase-related [Holotrichia oblita]|uniref:Tryptase-related n=2 Tax=Holotrichia oblita TaxID=644536 RepID=A0ACB9SWV4_HOLOL|nr:tryptase-related [Holotrichia oblita]KAI4459022.1 tryptase-related [Holotrichia oblita]
METSRRLFLLVQLSVYLGIVLCAGEGDVCVLIRDCKSAWTLSREELVERICDYEDGRYPKIWCQVPCVTPDYEKGVCTAAEKCDSFTNYVRNSDRNDYQNRNYLRKFVCDPISNKAKHYICCQDKPLKGIHHTATSPTTSVHVIDRYNEQCGIGNDQFKVVQGRIAELGEHPWAALLQYQKRGRLSVKCGGTLINRRYVLTAGHCINEREGKLVNVILGEHNTTTPIDCHFNACAPRPKVIAIEKITQHPGWVSGSPQFFDDIALLRLAEDVQFSEFIQPICLPTVKSQLPPPSTKLTVVGWGRTESEAPNDIKRKGVIYRQDSSKCMNTISIPLRKTQICVGGGIVDSCKGDSGGPLMMSTKGTDGGKIWHLVGVVSLGYDNPCGSPGQPGIYTSVSEYLDWIRQTMY